MADPNIAEWVSAAAASVTSLTLLALIWQVRSDHEKARREKSLDLLRQWDDIRKPDSFRYERLMFELSARDVAQIQSGKAIEIHADFAKDYFPEMEPDASGKYVIDAPTSRQIRSNMLTLLNTLENMALAYKHGVADRDILDEAYYNLLIEKDLLRKCRNFMEHFGAEAGLPSMIFPA